MTILFCEVMPMEKKKMRAAAGGMVALSLLFGNMFTPDDDLLNNDYSTDTGTGGSKLSGQVLEPAHDGSGLKTYSTAQRAFLSLPYGIRAVLVYPLWLMGQGIMYLFSLAVSFFSTALGGIILRIMLTAIISLGIYVLLAKLIFPQMPLSKILSKKNVSTVLLSSVALASLSAVLSAVWPDYGRWAPIIRVVLVALSVAIVIVSVKNSLKRKLPAH